jgi:hypothetical protein
MAALLVQKHAELSVKLKQHLGLDSKLAPGPQTATDCAPVAPQTSTTPSVNASVQLLQAEEAIFATASKIQALSYIDSLRGGGRRKAEDLLTR